MKRTGSLIVVVALLVIAGAAVGHVLGRRADTRELTGVIGSEKTAFFADPAVKQALAGHGIRLRLDPAGSRRMADMNLGGYDFAFPGSAPAAVEITRRRTPPRRRSRCSAHPRRRRHQPDRRPAAEHRAGPPRRRRPPGPGPEGVRRGQPARAALGSDPRQRDVPGRQGGPGRHDPARRLQLRRAVRRRAQPGHRR
ncbi:hypothetical protein [Dactylosporangium cerinum]